MLRISNIQMPVKHTENMLKGVVANLLEINVLKFKSFEISGQAIDARKKIMLFMFIQLMWNLIMKKNI